jgi:hypothetical protein
MQHLTIRLIARRSDVDLIIDALSNVNGIENIQLIDDLVPQMGKESPATIARPADLHPTLCSIEVDFADTVPAMAVRKAMEAAARERGIAPEFIDKN